jgi:hypothetical protein
MKAGILMPKKICQLKKNQNKKGRSAELLLLEEKMYHSFSVILRESGKKRY